MSTITYKLRTLTGDTLNLSNIPYGMSLEDETIRIYGSPGEDRIYVGPGLNLDLTILGLGNDRIYFTGALDDYTQTIDQDSAIYTFTHKTRTTEVVRVQSMGQNDVLYFADGHYVFNANEDARLYNPDTWESFAITAGMLEPGGTPVPQTDATITIHDISDDTGVSASDYVTSDHNGLTITASLSRPLENLQSQGSVGATLPMRIFIKGADGADIPYLGLSGQAMQIVGSAGVDNIYVGLGVAVDARVLGQGDDRIYFTGALEDYIQTIEQDSGVYTFTHKTRPTEVVRLTSMGENDELWFADGHIVFNAVTDTRLYDEVAERFMEVDASWLSAGGSPLVVEKLQYSNDGGITWQDVNHAIGADGISITLHDPTLTSTANIQFRVINQVSSGAVTSQQVTIDTVAPDAPVIGVIADDDEIEALERPSATVQGTSEANAFIELSFSSGFVRQVQADGMGNWSYSLTAADFTAMGVGAHIVSATASDLAGNTNGNEAQRIFTVLTQDETPPEITGPSGAAGAASSSDSVQENSTAVHTFTADEAVTWSLDGGVDAAHFSIDANTGALVFLSAPDYEAPTDDGTDNTYTVVVRATDAAGNASNQTVTITVTNANDIAPVFTSGTAVNFAENGTGTVYTAVATDADNLGPLTYSLSGTDAGLFDINASTGVVTFKTPPNHGAPADAGANNVYDITVTASDGIHTTDRSVAITVTDMADDLSRPVFTSGNTASVFEGILTTTTVYDANATDDVAVTHYSLAAGGHNDLFNINASTGVVTFKAVPSVVADTVYNITVYAHDSVGSTAQAVAVTVKDLPTAPALSLGTWGQLILPVVVEGKTYYVWDRNASGTHESPGDGFTHIELDAIFRYDVNGVLEIAGNKVGNEGQTDNTYRYASINGVHVALPTYGGPMIGEVVAATQSWNGTAVSSGAVNNPTYDDLLAIWDAYNGNGTGPGGLGVPPGWGMDYFWSATPHGHQSIIVNGTSGYVWNEGGQFPHQVALQVLSQITSGGTASVAENTAASAVVYDAEGWTSLGNGELTWSIVGGTDAALLTIDARSGEVRFLASPDYEAPTDGGANNTYRITVRATTSNGGFMDKNVVITVTNVNESGPVFTSGTSASFAENGTGTAYTAVATDADGDTLVYSLSGTDAARFNINSSTGAVTFKVAPNFEAPTDSGSNNVYDIVVTASDGTNTANRNVAITVTNVNDNAPVFTSGTSVNFAENGTGTVYDANATDADGNTITFSLSGTDAARFNINSSNGIVTFKAAPNYEAPTDSGANNVYNITVNASDGVHVTGRAVTINVTNVAERGDAVIALGGGLGNLIRPVIVDGNKYYYYWDRNGDGVANDGGAITFAQANRTSLGGFSVALPTAGGNQNKWYNGTAIDNSPVGENNPTYDGLLAIWDAHNGTGTGTGMSGTPAGWNASGGYWSNDPGIMVALSSGHVQLGQYAVQNVVYQVF
jgi:hypothetical protein